MSVPGVVRWNGYLQLEGRLRVSAAGVIVDCDEAAANALRVRPAELRGMPAARAFAGLGRRAVAWWNSVSADRQPATRRGELPGLLEITDAGLDGAFRSTVFALIAGRPGHRESLSIAVRATGLDPAEEVALLRAEVRAVRGLDLPAGHVTLVVDGDLVVSRAFTSTGRGAAWEPWRLVGLPVLAAVHPDDRPSALKSLVECLATPGGTSLVSVRVRPTPGVWTLVDVSLRNELHDPDIGGVICEVLAGVRPAVIRERSDEAGHRDWLTGLPTRLGLEFAVDAAAHQAHSRTLTPETAAVIIDIDGLEQMNQDLGYDAGDAVVRETAARLAELVEPDRIARLGGGRFVIVGPYGGPPRRLKALARSVLRATALPVAYLTHQIPVTVVVGTATGGADGLAGLLQRAGLSLNVFRLSADGEPQVFGPELANETLRRARLALGLRDLDLDAELSVAYQPVVAMASGQPVGYEALLRWTHPQLGPVPAEVFIPLAESMGAIGALGGWVLRRAAADAARWPEELSLSVNVSARQLGWPGFADEVLEVLQATGLPAGRLILEVTETAVLEQSDAATANLDALARLGVRFSLDDFGTGFSSLSLLHRLPIHELKIDRSFVASLGLLEHSQAIVATVIELARALGVNVIAEGVETDLQRKHLMALGCQLGQGYLLGRPAPWETGLEDDGVAADGLG